MPSAPSRQACAKTVGAVVRDVFVEEDAHVGIAQQPRQRGLAVEEWAIAQIIAVMLDQVDAYRIATRAGLPDGAAPRISTSRLAPAPPLRR
jgi:hypothetical protein